MFWLIFGIVVYVVGWIVGTRYVLSLNESISEMPVTAAITGLAWPLAIPVVVLYWILYGIGWVASRGLEDRRNDT